MSRAGVQLAVAVCVAGLVCAPARGQPVSPTRRAAKLYQTAHSRYREGKWAEARPLLEQFLKTGATHECAPTAYLQLAHCCRKLKDEPAYAAALDEVAKRFAGSPAWFIAYAVKLKRARADKDKYLDLLEELTEKAHLTPLWLHTRIQRHHGQYMSEEYRRQTYDWSSGRMIRPDQMGRSYSPGRGWMMDIVGAADTAERAGRALKILEKTLETFARELPVNWQYTRVLLLRRAGKGGKAEEAFKKYLDDWADDPNGIHLWTYRIGEARKKADRQALDRIYKRLLETYDGADRLSDLLAKRLEALYRQGRADQFVPLAKYYMDKYAPAYKWWAVLRQWVSVAVGQAKKKKDDAPILEMLKMLEALAEPNRKGWHQANVDHRIRLLIELKRFAAAAELIEGRYIAPPGWSARSFRTVCKFASTHKQFAPLVGKARKRWDIPLPNPTGRAFVLLNQLKVRLADDQVRHAEEVAEEMFAKHTQAASTIEGVKLMADYYFRKVLPEPRDKWMDRMIRSYPRHPLTEAVLANRITAELAAQQHERAAAAIDAVLSRFPTSRVAGRRLSDRLRCFDAAKDGAGKRSFVLARYGPSARAGSMSALGRIAGYDRFEDIAARADAWVERARAAAGSRMELYCLAQAYEQCYWYGYRLGGRYGEGRVPWTRIAEVLERLRTQTLDAEVRWRMAFSEVNFLIHRGKPAEALAALDKLLPEGRQFRSLSARLDMVRLGGALGSKRMFKQGRSLVKKLRRVCFTGRDAGAIEAMQAAMYLSVKSHAAAAEHYLKIAHAARWPARGYPAFRLAAEHLRKGNPRRYPQEVRRFMRKISRVQEVVPPLLGELGAFYLGHRSRLALRVQKELHTRYPASAAREKLDRALSGRPRK